MTHPGATLDALRDAGHRVRLEGDRIMIAPPPTDPATVAAIKANRDALLGLLRLEEEQRGWPAGEAAALAFWLDYNASVAANCRHEGRSWGRVLHDAGFHLILRCDDCLANVLGPGKWAARGQCPHEPATLPVFDDRRSKSGKKGGADLFDAPREDLFQ